MKWKMGYCAKAVRESQSVSVEELHEEMVKIVPVTIDIIVDFENGIYEDHTYGEFPVDFADFIGFYYKCLLSMNNKAAKEIFDHVEIWKKREETLRTFVMAENQFKKLKRYVNTVKKAALKEEEQEVYEQMIDFEEYFQDMVKLEMGVNRYSWA
jgi:hypothetical protein